MSHGFLYYTVNTFIEGHINFMGFCNQQILYISLRKLCLRNSKRVKKWPNKYSESIFPHKCPHSVSWWPTSPPVSLHPCIPPPSSSHHPSLLNPNLGPHFVSKSLRILSLPHSQIQLVDNILGFKKNTHTHTRTPGFSVMWLKRGGVC